MWGGIGEAVSGGTRIVSKYIFNGNGGYGYKIGKHVEVMYKNPSKGNPAGTLFRYNNKLKKKHYRIDFDYDYGYHQHWGWGKKQKIHRNLLPWKFGKHL